MLIFSIVRAITTVLGHLHRRLKLKTSRGAIFGHSMPPVTLHSEAEGLQHKTWFVISTKRSRLSFRQHRFPVTEA
jgi:hypothetical protein